MPKKKRPKADLTVVAPVSNYYGAVWVESKGGKYFFGVDDDSAKNHVGGRVEVSREFFDAFVKEFSQQHEGKADANNQREHRR